MTTNEQVFPIQIESLIISDSEYVRFLHRAQLPSEASIEDIFSRGLIVRGIVKSIATRCPESDSMVTAKELYSRRQGLDEVVFVIELPRDEFEEHERRLREESDYTDRPEDEFLEFRDLNDGIEIYLPGKYIRGYIIRESNEFVSNPHYVS